MPAASRPRRSKAGPFYFGRWGDPDAALARYQGRHEKKIASAAKAVKPAKPHPDFPLYAHASGQWAKRVRGKLRYFGSWGDPDAALAKYLKQNNDPLSG